MYECCCFHRIGPRPIQYSSRDVCMLCVVCCMLYVIAEIGLDGDTQAQQESVLNVTIYFELGF